MHGRSRSAPSPTAINYAGRGSTSSTRPRRRTTRSASKLDVFHLFQHLPMELQLQILRLLIPPRLVEVHWSHQHQRFVSITPIPPVFQLNRKLRAELLQLYPPSFAFRDRPTHIYCHARDDTVFFDFTLSKRSLVRSYLKGLVPAATVDSVPPNAWRLFGLFSKEQMELRLGGLLCLTPVGDQGFQDRLAGYRQSLVLSGGPRDPSIFEDIEAYVDELHRLRQQPAVEIGWTLRGSNPWRQHLYFLHQHLLSDSVCERGKLT